MRDAEKDLKMCEEATPGPWRWEDGEGIDVGRFVGSNGKIICDFGASEYYHPTEGTRPEWNDEKFIAEARTALPHWIQRAVVAEAEVERLKNTMRSMSGSLIAWSMHLDDTVLTPLQFRELQRITKPLFEA